MNKINLLLTCVVFSFISQMSFAEEKVKSIIYTHKFLNLKINYDTNTPNNILNTSLHIIKNNTLNDYLLNSIDSLTVNLNLLKSSDKISFSNANKNSCNITLNYDINLKGLLLKDYSNDLSFTYFHEISHCILGKKIFMTGVLWEPALNLSVTRIAEINKQIDILTEQATVQMQCDTNCLSINVFKKPPPLVVYHEMFADISAILLLGNCKKNEDLFKEIKNTRENNYLSSPSVNMYQSFRVFNYISPDELCNKKFDFKIISYYTQKAFLNYLEEVI